ncbi:MAG: NAD(P)-dependent oxidoreductase [Thermoplasmata archaeon]|nr:MAG: NAD(P)-dependent oxidoreductase [Thermoplasmata archaeon]
MPVEKLMIVGGSGLLGGHLIDFAQDEFVVWATFNSHPFERKGCKTIPMDITDARSCEKSIIRIKPDFIILTAAQRNVDYCEKNQSEVWRINVEGPKNVVAAAKKVGAKMIYLSTDLVFDGESEHYVEDDRANPINLYGRTKFEGEREVAANMDDCAIARVSVLYDWNPFHHTFNFGAWVYDSLRQGREMALFTDQFGNATYIKNACEALVSMYKSDEKGVFHVAGKHCVDRYSIGLQVADVFGFDRDLISATTSDKGDWFAQRPKKCCLDVEKMEKRLGIPAMSIEEGLLAMRDELEGGKVTIKPLPAD